MIVLWRITSGWGNWKMKKERVVRRMMVMVELGGQSVSGFLLKSRFFYYHELCSLSSSLRNVPCICLDLWVTIFPCLDRMSRIHTCHAPSSEFSHHLCSVNQIGSSLVSSIDGLSTSDMTNTVFFFSPDESVLLYCAEIHLWMWSRCMYG